MVSGYTRRPSSDVDIQVVNILEVNLADQVASGLTRERHEITIQTKYPVGEVHVVPAQGEQWYVERINGFWRLKSRVPFNDDTQHGEDKQGQVRVGTNRGPLELFGEEVNLHSPIHLPSYTSDTRPTNVRVGAMIWDSDLDLPIFLSSSGWVDASGSPV